jgi:antitoxin component YwqK of YwqJK toxin-antitoxin module
MLGLGIASVGYAYEGYEAGRQRARERGIKGTNYNSDQTDAFNEGVMGMNIKTKAFIGGLIGGVIISAVLFNSVGYGKNPVWVPVKEPVRKPIRKYYESGKLFSEKFYGNAISEWTVKEYYENGPLRSETSYKNGKQEGIAKEYYRNGKLRSEISYKDGKREGPSKAYYENGRLKGEMAYKNGRIEGVLQYGENEPSGEEIVVKNGKEE